MARFFPKTGSISGLSDLDLQSPGSRGFIGGGFDVL